MRSIPFHLISLAFFITTSAADDEQNKKILEASKAATETAKELTDVVSSDKWKDTYPKIASLGGKLGQWLGPIGAGLGIVTSMIDLFSKQPSEFDKVHEHLNIISAEIKAIDTKLDTMTETILNEMQFNRLLERRDLLRNVNHDAQRFIRRPDRVTHQELIASCNRSPPRESIQWIMDELDLNTVGFGVTLTKLKDLIKLQDHCKFMVYWVTQAAQLANFCMNTKYSGDSFKKEIEFFEADIEFITKMTLTRIANRLKTEGERIDTDTFSWAVETAKEFSSKTSDEKSHGDFCRELMDKLTEKYSWKDWLVLSYNKDVDGFAKNTFITSGRSHWERDGNRCFAIAESMVPNEDWTKKVDDCISDGHRPHDAGDKAGCDRLVDYLTKCVPEDRALLGCVLTRKSKLEWRFVGASLDSLKHKKTHIREFDSNSHININPAVKNDWTPEYDLFIVR